MGAMLTGRMLRASAAKAMGLIDQIVPSHHNLRWAARKAVLQKRRSKGAPWWKRLMAKQPVRGLLARQMRAEDGGEGARGALPRAVPAHRAVRELWRRPRRHARGRDRALRAADGERDLAQSPPRVLLSEMLKDEAPKDGFKPLRVHVIGAGTMGGDIAAWCVVCGMQASLQDLDEAQIGKALGRAKSLFRRQLRGTPAIDAAIGRLIAVLVAYVKRADVVIEATWSRSSTSSRRCCSRRSSRR